MAYVARLSTSMHGWEVVTTSTLGLMGYDKDDKHNSIAQEIYDIGIRENTSQPDVWLPDKVLPGFREFTSSVYWRCNEITEMLLRALALGL